jgi:hypothetical protein
MRMFLPLPITAALNLKPAPNSTIVHLSIRTFAPAPEGTPYIPSITTDTARD